MKTLTTILRELRKKGKTDDFIRGYAYAWFKLDKLSPSEHHAAVDEAISQAFPKVTRKRKTKRRK